MYAIIHLTPERVEQDYKFDTVISPSGTVAALTRILRTHAVANDEIMAFDQGIHDYDGIHGQIREVFDAFIQQNPSLIIWCLFSVLLYNAKATKRMIDDLRSRYEQNIKVILGGQHPSQMYKLTWMAHFLDTRNYDHVLLWDGELQIPKLVAYKEWKWYLAEVDYDSYEYRARTWKAWEGIWVWSAARKKYIEAEFSTMEYSYFYNLKERLEQQLHEAWFTQICRQGQWGPWCSRAANNKWWACLHCALQNITIMNNLDLQKNLQGQFETIVKIKEQTDIQIDRIFMVDNQFLPYWWVRENKKRLQEMLDEKQKLQKLYGFTFSYYVYLTENSLWDEEIISLLSSLWVVEVYVGFDHPHPLGLAEQNKGSDHKSKAALRQRNVWKTFPEKVPSMKDKLDRLKKYGIHLRRWNVLWGTSETQETITAFYEAIERATHPDQWYVAYGTDGKIDKERSTITAIGVFPFEVLPGAKFFEKFRKECFDETNMRPGKKAAKALMDFLVEYGYRDRQQQLLAQKLYIEHYSDVWYERVREEKEKILDLLEKRWLLWYTVDKSPDGTVLKN